MTMNMTSFGGYDWDKKKKIKKLYGLTNIRSPIAIYRV